MSTSGLLSKIIMLLLNQYQCCGETLFWLCNYCFFFTSHNKVVAKVIFLHLSVIHSVHRGVLPQCMLAYHHTPLPQEQIPQEQTSPQKQTPMGPDTPREQTSLGSRLQHMVYEQPVHILLECILVGSIISH